MARITRIEISNFKGIEHLVAQLGSLTIVSGANGTGKTSFHDALLATFEGGHDASLIRRGAERAEIVVTLDNGTKITRVITDKVSVLQVVTSDGSEVRKPAAFVQSLASGFALDPIALIQAKPQDRAKYLLESLPITFQPEEVDAAGGGRPAGVLNLETFEGYRAGVYERRRQLNVEAKELASAVQAIRKIAISEADEDLAKSLPSLQQRAGALKQQWSSICADIDRERELAIAKAEAAYRARLADIDREYVAASTERTAAINEEMRDVHRQIDRAKGAAETIAQVEAQIKNEEQFSARAKAKSAEADRLTAQIEALDALKQRKLAAQSIDGVTIHEGQLYVDGILFDNLNTQRQYFTAFQLAALGIGDLGLMVCDRFESIVGEQREAFLRAAADSGVQVIVCDAQPDRPLTVQTDGQPALIDTAPMETKGRRAGRRGQS